jgi:hypothetical protein
MTNEVIQVRRGSVVIAWPVAIALALLGGCGGKESGDGRGGTTEVVVQSKSGGPADRVVEHSDGTGGGVLKFTLDRGLVRQLPITVCTGFGTVLTIVGREGENQVDARIIENEMMRSGEPLETSTVSGYRTVGEDAGQRYEELWQSQRNSSVVRDGSVTRVVGTMTGQRFYATSETAFGPPQLIEGGGEIGFTLEAECGP